MGGIRNTSNRVGLGFNTQLSRFGVDSISLRSWTSDRLGFEGLFGFLLGDNTQCIDLGGKILFGIKTDRILHLYGFGLLGMENWSAKTSGVETHDTDVTVGGGFGVEFFFQGMPDLGFGTEIGLGYNSGTKQFGTLASWIPTVGMRYYF